MKSLLLLFICFPFISCHKKEETTTPVIQNITESVYASGYIKSKDQYQVFSNVNGILQNKYVDEGDLVGKGQVLFALVNETPRLTQENARLTASFAIESANRDKLRAMRTEIDLARAKLQNDSVLLQRQQNLWTHGIGSRNELEQRELAFRNSLTAWKSAILQYHDLQKQTDFSGHQSQKNLQISSSQLNDFTIRSKLSGRVYSVLKEQGEIVTPQTPLAIVGDAHDFLLELQVDEYDISRIRRGQKVMISMDSYKQQVFEGVVQKIDPYMDERSRTFNVEAVFTKRPDYLYPNMTVEANIIIQVKQEVLIIPRNYLIEDSVVLLKNKKRRRVVTGIRDYQNAEILNGLDKNDVIVKPSQ